MLWHVLWKNKNTFSLTFTIGFSLLGILWQANPFSQGVSFFGRLADRLSGTMNASLSLPQFLWIQVATYRDLEDKYAKAVAQLETSKLEKDRFQQLEAENNRLRELLEYPKNTDYPEVRAEVLGVRINSINPRIMINKGSNHGIKPYMPVIIRTHNKNKEVIRAVLGTVALVTANTSVIQPLNHPAFRLGVRLSESNQWAVLSGNAGRFNEVILSYVADDPNPDKAIHSAAATEIIPGQEVVTSGQGGVFPPGLPVGYVTREGEREGEFRTVYLKTYSDITRTSDVIVLLKNPESWSDDWDKNTAWDEHLLTEFGPPQFPENTLVKKPEPSKTPVKKTETEEQNTEAGQPAAPAETGPRRLRNVQLPAGGN